MAKICNETLQTLRLSKSCCCCCSWLNHDLGWPLNKRVLSGKGESWTSRVLLHEADDWLRCVVEMHRISDKVRGHPWFPLSEGTQLGLPRPTTSSMFDKKDLET